MTKEKEKELSEEVKQIVRQQVATDVREVRLGDLVIDTSVYSFRESDELAGKEIEELAARLATEGQLSNLFGRDLGNGKVLLGDGNRRAMAALYNVQKGTPGWTLDRLMRVNVAPANTTEGEFLALCISANISHKPYTQIGRAKAAASMHRQGWPMVQIAGVLGVNDKTISRDLAVASNSRAMELVTTKHVIQFSTLAGLIAKARKDKEVDRTEELFDALDDFATYARQENKKENTQRHLTGDAELSREQQYPVKRLTKARIAGWESALDTGKPFDQTETVQFVASVTKEKGVSKIKVTALNINVNELAFKDVTEIYERIRRFQTALGRTLQQRANDERLALPDEDMSAQLQKDFEALGIADLVKPTEPETDGDDATDFDTPVERVETDALDTGEETAE